MFAEGLLQSGMKQNIHLAEELLTPCNLGTVRRSRDPHLNASLNVLKYKVSVSVVVEAAKEYFASATSFSDSSMELAR